MASADWMMEVWLSPTLEGWDALAEADRRSILRHLPTSGVTIPPEEFGAPSGASGAGKIEPCDFVVDIAAITSPLVALVVAWIQRRNGRKVRIRLGDIEVEAQSIEEVERAFERIKDVKQKLSEKGEN
jgi:hypothetical protein